MPPVLRYDVFRALRAPRTNASAPAFVFLHGFLGHRNTWITVVKKLQARIPHAECFTIDARNHGNSPHCPKHAVGDLASDLGTFLDRHVLVHNSPLHSESLHQRPVILVGHSMGSLTSVAYLAGLGASPPCGVRALISIDMHPLKRIDAPSELITLLQQCVQSMQRVSLHNIVDVRSAQVEIDRSGCPSDPQLRSFLLTNLVIDRRKKQMVDSGCSTRWKCNTDILLSALDEIFIPSTFSPQDRLSLPTMCVVGSDSPMNDAVRYRHLWDNFVQPASFEWCTVDGAGHNLHYDKTDEFVDLLADFVWQAIPNTLN